MHEIRGRDKPQLQTGKKDRVLMCLLNTLYSSKKNEDTGLPEPVVTHEVRWQPCGGRRVMGVHRCGVCPECDRDALWCCFLLVLILQGGDFLLSAVHDLGLLQ